MGTSVSPWVVVAARAAAAAAAEYPPGRGLHSSTFQLKLRRF